MILETIAVGLYSSYLIMRINQFHTPTHPRSKLFRIQGLNNWIIIKRTKANWSHYFVTIFRASIWIYTFSFMYVFYQWGKMKAVLMFLKFECNELAYYLYILFIVFPKMKLFISAPNQILNASNILDKVCLTKERAPIYPKPFSGVRLFG